MSKYKDIVYYPAMSIAENASINKVEEKDIRYFIKHSDLPVVHSCCPQDKNSDRERVKQLLNSLDKENKGIKYRIFGAMQRAEVDGFKLMDTGALKEI